MRKEVRQGLGLVAIAVALGLLWAVTEARLLGVVAVWVALGGLALVALGLLTRPAD